MSTFKFGEIRVDVHRTDPDPLSPKMDFYAIRVSHGNTWLETLQAKPRADRMAGSDFSIAMTFLLFLSPIAQNPEGWETLMRSEGKMSQEEIDATVDVALALGPYLDEALDIAHQRLGVYLEHFESGIGPFEMGIGRRLDLPVHIRTKEDIARFFAYLYIVDHTSFHPDDRFGEYVDNKGKRAYTRNEAATRDWLMSQSWGVAKENGLDIYEVALWVGALTGVSEDPENETSAPDWLKSLSSTWA